MLKRMCAEKPKDWDKYINALLFAYREVPQESLGFAPFELLYGHTVRGPMQILKELWTEEIPDDDVKTTYQYICHRLKREIRGNMQNCPRTAREGATETEKILQQEDKS